MDGLAIDQWLILKDVLKAQGLNAPIEENALFAWMPTITPISRQAAFAGKVPRYFADSLHRTDRDEAGWRQFWADHSLSPAEIAFAAVPGDPPDLARIEDIITSQTRVLGVTLFKVDKIMHGMKLGAVGMAGQVRTWAEEGFLSSLLNSLHKLGFDVFISADHGNTEAVGIGDPKEGVLSDKGGERCRIYSDPALNKTCLTAFPETLVWDHPGLPDGLSTLLAPQGKAFSQKDTTLLCHGGPGSGRSLRPLHPHSVWWCKNGVTMRAKVEIVFRRKVRAIWLEQGMALAAQGLPWNDAKPALVDPVAAENPGAETIRKVLEHVRRIWFEPPDNCTELRSAALVLFRASDSPASRTLLNWGMAIAAYPFVGSAGEVLGRLLKLQKEARRADVQRRLREQYGDRDFVNRIARYTVSSFLDWGVIAETKKAGVYLPGKKNQCRSGEQLAWLAEAVLISRGETQVRFSQLCNHPLLFPFSVETFNASILRANPRLKVARQGLNEDFVFLETTIAQPVQLSCPKQLSPALP